MLIIYIVVLTTLIFLSKIRRHIMLKPEWFFSNLSAIHTFFFNTSNRCDILEEIVEHTLREVSTWNYNIRTCVKNWEKVIEVFVDIEDKSLRGYF